MINFGDACGRTCVAGHLVIAASKARAEVNDMLTENSNVVVERKIEGPYVDAGRIGPTGGIFVVNGSNGIFIALDPIRMGSDIAWRCFIYPEEMKNLLINEKCQLN